MISILLRALTNPQIVEAIAAIVGRVVLRANEDQLARLRADLSAQTAELRRLIADLEQRFERRLLEMETRVRLLEREAFGELPPPPPPLPEREDET